MYYPFSDISLKEAVKDENLKESLLRALYMHKGIKSFASKHVGVPITLIPRLMDLDPEFKKNVLAIEEAVVDAVEWALFAKIEEGVVPAIIFYLDRKGRSRGYSRDNAELLEGASLSFVELPKKLK
jgi:hypothetical protein